jgi:AcrR family transcriptional regulator
VKSKATAKNNEKNANDREQRRRRLDPQARERQILEGAISFFAEVGFAGQTRELASRLGITQPLLYRYFPSKEHLIERVYQEVYIKRWQPHWEVLITDRSRPLEERLIDFYHQYTRAIFHYEWVRIFMFAGLMGVNINRRYLTIVRQKLFVPLCTELREAHGLPSVETLPISDEEIELATSLHGGIYYAAIRKWIYGLPIPEDLDAHVVRVVQTFLHGAPDTLRHHFAAHATLRQ